MINIILNPVMVLIILNPTTAHAWKFLVMYGWFTSKIVSKNGFCLITKVTGHLENAWYAKEQLSH